MQEQAESRVNISLIENIMIYENYIRLKDFLKLSKGGQYLLRVGLNFKGTEKVEQLCCLPVKLLPINHGKIIFEAGI